MSTEILTPIGRLVSGSLYIANEKDWQGNPLKNKAGEPRKEYFFAIAVPKKGETHWNQTDWGATLYRAAQGAWPQGQYQRPDFAWKIDDGDSQQPNKNGIKPCDRPGWPGHWILKFSGGFPPTVLSADGRQTLKEEGHVKPGYYIQVFGSVAGNDNLGNPGIYLNHTYVAFSAYGEEIRVGVDPASIGFGQGALPAGASATPVSGMAQPPAAAPTPTGAALPPAPAVPVAMPAPPPNPAILQPPAAPVRKMTAKAQGFTYEALVAQGWTDDLLRQHGMME